MEKGSSGYISEFLGNIPSFLRRCLFQVLSFGPIPHHIAFILDGNRRYARIHHLEAGMGHRYGFLALLSILKYCYELGVKYVTIYAFSIDNFKRKPDEVHYLMDLILEKLEVVLREENIVKQYGVKIDFLGNLKLFPEPVRKAAEKAMAATAQNNGTALLVCVAYTSTDDIVHAIQGLYKEKQARIQQTAEGKQMGDDDEPVECSGGSNLEEFSVSSADLERHMYFAGYPDPDILIRSGGETRLSNFILWQSTFCLLNNPKALWPDISLWHLVWAILQYQRVHPFFEKKQRL
ncbi:hypothetical protein AAC387_Pa01g0198 [Persea americana]